MSAAFEKVDAFGQKITKCTAITASDWFWLQPRCRIAELQLQHDRAYGAAAAAPRAGREGLEIEQIWDFLLSCGGRRQNPRRSFLHFFPFCLLKDTFGSGVGELLSLSEMKLALFICRLSAFYMKAN